MQGPLHHGAGQDLVPAALCLRQGGVRHLAAGGRLRRGTGWGFFLKKLWEIIKKFLFFFSVGYLYCEDCYGKYLAPDCEKCRKKITGVSKETFLKSNYRRNLSKTQKIKGFQLVFARFTLSLIELFFLVLNSQGTYVQ